MKLEENASLAIQLILASIVVAQIPRGVNLSRHQHLIFRLSVGSSQVFVEPHGVEGVLK